MSNKVYILTGICCSSINDTVESQVEVNSYGCHKTAMEEYKSIVETLSEDVMAKDGALLRVHSGGALLRGNTKTISYVVAYNTAHWDRTRYTLSVHVEDTEDDQ